MNFRIGEGWDVHALVPGRPLVIGGVEIAHSMGLLGHSDADVLLHAITDALLGAAALGDIGSHFPDTDVAFRGADSGVLLAEAARRVRAAGYDIGNIDSTVVAQAPRLAAHIPAMRVCIAAAAGAGLGLSIVDKTVQRMGGIFALANSTSGGLVAHIQLQRATNMAEGEDPKQRLQRPAIKRQLPRRRAEDKPS